MKGSGFDINCGQILACTVQGRIELYEFKLQSSVKSYEIKLKMQEFRHSSEASLVIFSENQILLGTNAPVIKVTNATINTDSPNQNIVGVSIKDPDVDFSIDESKAITVKIWANQG